MNARLAALCDFPSWSWRSALEDMFAAGAETARLNPGIDGSTLWRMHGPEADPSSWDYDCDAGSSTTTSRGAPCLPA